MSEALANAAPLADPGPAPAVEVENLSVSYRVRLARKSMWEDFKSVVGRRSQADRLVPALRDVSFQVPHGEVLAVIGRNGAGKTTLVRTISGALPPDSGRVTVRGRINLLSLGLGFDATLTGRENIKLGGLALGLPMHRLPELTATIAEFAQLDEFIDYPMKTYSAGMRSRLAFSVASNLDPEILLIDEALGGGDAGFNEHAREAMQRLCGEGRTIILVTHGLAHVRTMATHAMWLHQGRVAQLGEPEEVLSSYMRYCRIEQLPDE